MRIPARPGHRGRCRHLVGLVFSVWGAGTACDRLLEVNLPTQVPARQLDSPAAAPLLVQSAIAALDCALTHYAGTAGLWTDEMYAATNLGISAADLHNYGPVGFWASVTCESDIGLRFGTYASLSVARFEADDALKRLADFPDAAVPGKAVLMATAAAYAGYAYTLFGEGFCAAAFDLGPRLTPPQVLQRAEERFTTAVGLAQQAGNSDIQSMALVGRARVRLDLGKLVEAAADAKLVPQGYSKVASRSAAHVTRENSIYTRNYRNQVISVDPRFRNLTVGGVPDPRVRTIDGGRRGNDGVTPLWYQTKYTSESSPVTIASWVEAQLIVAEAEGGQSAVTRINALRARFLPSLPAFASTDSATIVQQVREERKRELFLEGHRLNDMLRFGIPLDVGSNLRGQRYGTATCLPLPQVEIDNNPNAR